MPNRRNGGETDLTRYVFIRWWQNEVTFFAGRCPGKQTRLKKHMRELFEQYGLVAATKAGAP